METTIAIRVKYLGVTKPTVYAGTLSEWSEYFGKEILTEESLVSAAYSHFGRVQNIAIAKRYNQAILIQDKLEEIAQQEAETKRIAAIRKEQRRIARTEAFFDSLLYQDNVKVSLGTSTLINDIRLFQVVYDLTSTRCSFEDLMQLKEDTGLTVKFEITRIQHEIDTVETNYSRGYDSY
jgi:hypothetical protein